MNIPNANINPIASATVMRTPFGRTPEPKYSYHRRQLLSKNRVEIDFLFEYHRFAYRLKFSADNDYSTPIDILHQIFLNSDCYLLPKRNLYSFNNSSHETSNIFENERSSISVTNLSPDSIR